MSETANQTIPNRRQRRAAMKHQGILKMKGKLPFKEWLEICRKTRERAKKYMEQMLKLLKNLYMQN